MKLYAPKYYKEFRCIADQCEHSCCIGWEIDVDEDTVEKYKMLKGGYGDVIMDSISMDGAPHFKLGAGDRCPHLDERGLCRIILNVGEDHLCHICREHPRFYNYTDVAEVGLGMSCIEASRVILASPDYGVMEEIGELDAEPDDIPFDGREMRRGVYAMLQDESMDYAHRLDNVYRAHGIEAGEDDRWLEVLRSLEYLNDDHKALFTEYASAQRPNGKEQMQYLQRFLAYLIYRHCTEAIDGEDFCIRLGFCLFCERLLASLICSHRADSLQSVARLASVISEEIEYSDDNTDALMELAAIFM